MRRRSLGETSVEEAPIPWARGLRQFWLDLALHRKGLVVVLLPMLVIVPTIVGTIALGRDQSEVRARNRAASVLFNAVDLEVRLVAESETAARGYAATGDEQFLAPNDSAIDGFEDALVAARNAASDPHLTDDDEATVDAIERKSRGLMSWIAQVRAQIADGSLTGDGLRRSLLDGGSEMNQLRVEGEGFKEELTSRINDGRDRVEATQRAITAMLVAALVLVGLAAVLGMYLLTNGIVRRVNFVGRNARTLSDGGELEHIEASRDEIGEMVSALSHASTLLAEQNAALGISRDRAVEATRAKDEFLSRVSHELRTPLTAIIGFGGLLQFEDLAPADRDSVDHIVKAGRHLLALINDLINISQVESGNLSLSLEPVPLIEAVEETAALLRPIAADGDVNIAPIVIDDPEGLLDDDEEPTVHGDRQRLKQVLLNLMSNAIKYNVRGGSIVVRASVAIDTVRVEIADTGRGFNEASVQRLFQPFERLDATDSGIEGTGVGLALCKSLVEAMHGTIGANSTVGVGSTFWFELPRAPVIARAPDRWSGDHADDDHAVTTVLYVEDNPASAAVFEAIFARRAERLQVVGQGSLVIDLARGTRPALILLDQHLPDVSGEDVLLALKADQSTCDIPVVIISAEPSPSRQRRMIELGAIDYLVKPLDVRRVIDLLDEHASRSHHA